jgi:hypothetical protein
MQNEINKHAVLRWSPGFINNRPFDLDDEQTITSIDYHAIERYRKHTVELVRDKYKEQFDDVELIPLHLLPKKWGQGDPLLGYIFCQSLKTLTPHTCHQVELGVLGQNVSSNPSKSVNYPVLADAAFAKKMLPPNILRPALAIDRIRKHQEQFKKSTVNDFPLKCMRNETIDQFEILSLELERRLFPDNWTVANEDAHHAGFLGMLAKKQHCHIDTDTILAEKSWKDFFNGLSHLVGEESSNDDAAAGKAQLVKHSPPPPEKPREDAAAGQAQPAEFNANLPTIVLHVGLQKSGTFGLENALCEFRKCSVGCACVRVVCDTTNSYLLLTFAVSNRRLTPRSCQGNSVSRQSTLLGNWPWRRGALPSST